MQFHAALMGVNFRGPAVRELVADLPVGEDRFDFERDPANQYDPNAIKVLLDGEFLGFVAKEVAEELAPLMDAGYEVSGKIIDFLGTIKPFLQLEATLDDEEAEDEQGDAA